MFDLRHTPNGERLLTALRGGVPDRVPYLDVAVAAPLVNAVLGTEGKPDSQSLEVPDLLEFARRVGLDAVYVNFLWKLGRVYRQTADGESQYVDGSIKSRDQLAEVAPPDLGPTLRRLEEICDAAHAEGLAVILASITPYKTVKAAVGYQDFLVRTVDDYAFLVEFRDLVTTMLDEALRRFLEFPVDVLLIPGDLCFNSGPMLSPRIIADYWVANTRRFVEPARAKGLPVILHMDGDFSSITDMMVEAGADAFHPFEVTGGLDIYTEKRKLQGRAAVMGNIDCAGVLTQGSPEDVREDVRRHIEGLAPGGGYVCGSSHEIGPDTPVENFRALVEAVAEFGEY